MYISKYISYKLKVTTCNSQYSKQKYSLTIQLNSIQDPLAKVVAEVWTLIERGSSIRRWL